MNISEVRQHAEEYIRWDPVESTRKEIQTLLEAENWEELEKRVIGRLTFGTAGEIKTYFLMYRFERKNRSRLPLYERSRCYADGPSKEVEIS